MLTSSPSEPGKNHFEARQVKYVFVCGLHRSGTTILAQSIGQLPNCTIFEHTGAVMDEGQHLQDVYPPDYVYGGVGKFGFASQVHLTEGSSLLNEANVLRLRESWENYWDRHKTIRIEKTPGNLLMTRFLQAAFPNAYFVVIKRHPVAVSLASQKWSRSPLHHLFEHWLRCHEIFEEDKRHLENVCELSYEDYVEDPQKHLARIASFIGAECSDSAVRKVADIHNRRYLAKWAQMLDSSPFRGYYRSLAARYNKRFEDRGYSLLPGRATEAWILDQQVPVGRTFAPLLYSAADAYWVLWDAWWRSRRAVRQTARRYCPMRVKALLRDYKMTSTRRTVS
jgi:hypothetical protein